MNLISFLKKLPIDVGQAEKKHDTAGKRIAFSFVPRVRRSRSEGRDDTKKIAYDIGCRDGYWSERLKEKGYEVRSLDVEPHYAGALQHDLEKGLPYADRSCDVLWCTEVIEHLRNPSVFLKEIERIMRPGGIAIMTTPNSDWWFYWVVRLWGWTPSKLQNPDHKQFFNKKTLVDLAPRYRIFGYFPYAIFFYRVERLSGLLSPTFILVKTF